MVEIISRRDGPRPEDARLRQVLQQNRGTIERLADHLSMGAYSASKAPKPVPQAEGRTIVHIGTGAPARNDVHANVRVSLNGRVIAVDDGSGRQLHHLGDIRRRGAANVFVLATRPNGFFAPLADEVAAPLADLDGLSLEGASSEDALAEEIARRLGYR